MPYASTKISGFRVGPGVTLAPELSVSTEARFPGLCVRLFDEPALALRQVAASLSGHARPRPIDVVLPVLLWLNRDEFREISRSRMRSTGRLTMRSAFY
jgi:hypothetical protein